MSSLRNDSSKMSISFLSSKKNVTTTTPPQPQSQPQTRPNSNFVKYSSPLKHTTKLVNDLANLLAESDSYDVEIKVGTDKNAKTFEAHSNILKARSSYFNVALSTNWDKRS